MMIDFFVYSRDGADTAHPRDQLIEEHWSYMDRFAASMIARGPTLAADRETATGSLHVLGLPDLAAAREFVACEPNNLAGVYIEHSIWQFTNLLDQTMWEYTGDVSGPRFLAIALSDGAVPVPVAVASLPHDLRERLILYGALAAPDGQGMVGIALAVVASSREHVDLLLSDQRSGLAAFPSREVHDWEFGGRR